MSYAIAQVIYGIDLTEDFEKDEPDFFKHLPQTLQEECDPHAADGFGFTTSYSGNGPTPVWLGVELTSFDECQNFPLEDLVKDAAITPKVLKDWQKALDSLEPDVLKALEEAYGKLEPKVMVVWGSS